MPYIYSGVCLAAMFGSVVYEHRRMKKEELQLRETMESLAAKARAEAEICPKIINQAVAAFNII